jgi:hypothetical protein
MCNSRFHPHVLSSGQIMVDGQMIDAKGEAMFVAAIQGLRPDAVSLSVSPSPSYRSRCLKLIIDPLYIFQVASRWNFAFFTTTQGAEDERLGSVRAIQMEFETPDNYGSKGPKSGRVKCNIGCIYSSKLGQPLVVCSQTGPGQAAKDYGSLNPAALDNGDVCRATHLSTAKDEETGYDGPTALRFEWQGKQVGEPSKQVKASLEVQTSLDEGKGGLVEKVSERSKRTVLARPVHVVRSTNLVPATAHRSTS